MSKTVYDWILRHGNQVDFWHGVHKGWFQNCCAEEYAHNTTNPLGPFEGKLNGVVLTFEILEFLKQVPMPNDISPSLDTEQFWEDLHNGEFLLKGNPDEN